MTLRPVLARVGDDLLQDLQRVQALQVGVDGAGGVVEAEVLRHDRVFHHLVGERDPDRVVAEVLDVVDDRVVVLRPQAVRDLVGGLEAVPVDPGDPDRVAGGSRGSGCRWCASTRPRRRWLRGGPGQPCWRAAARAIAPAPATPPATKASEPASAAAARGESHVVSPRRRGVPGGRAGWGHPAAGDRVGRVGSPGPGDRVGVPSGTGRQAGVRAEAKGARAPGRVGGSSGTYPATPGAGSRARPGAGARDGSRPAQTDRPDVRP